ncbi:MAG: Hpt domain-containing protein [Treponema sp.]|jgi:HPt (histidine-containing phosphotransfer) domain-containing protein|nr:Hpt domain-containing protein [Treponema sp.]
MNDPDAMADGEHKKKMARVFSGAELCENFMGNMGLLNSILARFIKRTECQIAEIPVLAEKGDWESSVREAHTIKGSARSLSALDLGDTAMRWEEDCRQRDAAAVRARHSDVVEAFALFKAAAEGFLSRQGEDKKE